MHTYTHFLSILLLKFQFQFSIFLFLVKQQFSIFVFLVRQTAKMREGIYYFALDINGMHSIVTAYCKMMAKNFLGFQSSELKTVNQLSFSQAS